MKHANFWAFWGRKCSTPLKTYVDIFHLFYHFDVYGAKARFHMDTAIVGSGGIKGDIPPIGVLVS